MSRSENQMRARPLVISSREYEDIWSSVGDENEIKIFPDFLKAKKRSRSFKMGLETISRSRTSCWVLRNPIL